jgi:hypothetical protein
VLVALCRAREDIGGSRCPVPLLSLPSLPRDTEEEETHPLLDGSDGSATFVPQRGQNLAVAGRRKPQFKHTIFIYLFFYILN